MFKRANKVTALLVAAASVMSVVPAMAADKLGEKDGHIKEAIAYEDGKYAYYGYRTDDDDTGIWYNKGNKEKDVQIDDLEDYEIAENGAKFGTKYAYVTEDGNNDEYLVDLSNGKIADEDTPEDQEDSARAKLISGLKKAERYNSTSDSSYEVEDEDVKSARLFQEKFGETWYAYATTTGTAVDVTTSAGAKITTGSFGVDAFTGFTNESGKYIDASYLANVKVYSARKDKAVEIEKFGKVYKDEALKVDLRGLKALAQDKDYIYALAEVNVTYYKATQSGSTVTYDYATIAKESTQYFIQKISKARATDKEDGAYVPKSVEAWQLDSSDATTGVYKSDDDSEVAYDVITNVAKDPKYAVKDGVLYVTIMEEDDLVHVYKLKLGKDKRDLVNTELSGLSFEKNAGTDVDTKIITVDEDDDEDVEVGEETGKAAVSIDVDGNTWIINDGEIMMFDGTEFKTKFRCDQSYDRLDVYNEKSLIAWEDDGDSYTTVQEGKDQTVTDGKAIDPNAATGTTTAAQVGWVQLADGGWNFYDAAGTKVVNNWSNVGGVWYYLKADGVMATGWQQVGGTWYYLKSSGAMATGWVNVNGTWYYLQSSGAMKTGWLNDNGTWYYLNVSGAMLANTTVDGYKLGASGAWIQ